MQPYNVGAAAPRGVTENKRMADAAAMPCSPITEHSHHRGATPESLARRSVDTIRPPRPRDSRDATFEHEAWNRGTRTRVVLIIDVWNPHLTAAEREAVAALVEAMGDFNRAAGI